MNKKYQYDVVLSFAGEDRDYVEQVAAFLEANGIKVHYDRFDQVNAWGKNLAEHFDDIYRKQALYCFMFISEHYAKKVWPSFEKRSALAREVIEAGYILPVRFDDTEILGIPTSKAYIDLRQYNPQQLAQFIIEKLGKTSVSKPVINNQTFRRPKAVQSFDPYKERQGWMDFIIRELGERCKKIDVGFSHFDKGNKKCLRFMASGKVVYSIDIEFGGMARDHGLSFSYTRGEMQSFSSGYNAWADFEWDKERKCIVLKLNDFSAFSGTSGSDQNLTQQEFLEYIWSKICDAIDEKN